MIVSLFLVSLTIASCKKEDGNETTTPTLSDKGGLAFKVKDDEGEAITNATISIAVSQADLDDGKFLATKQTNSEGKADFGRYNAGDYYYEVDIPRTIPFHKEGVVQLQSGKDLELEVIAAD